MCTAFSRKRQKVIEFVEFQPVGKKILEPDRLSQKVGGLLDRRTTIEQLYRGLEKLAGTMGTPNLDKKRVPIIGITGPSETGKSEFLRWVFNNCCTFQEAVTNAKRLVQRLNQASSNDQATFDKLLVLFASFNQTSTYMKGEGPIRETTIERLLRSFHGNTSFEERSKYIRYEGFNDWHDIIDAFRNTYGNTGFIFILDELSKVREKDESQYRELMDSILLFSQECLRGGIFCAVIGSSLSIYDLGEVVVTRSRRVIEPINFPKEMPELEAKTREILRNETDVLKGAESNKESVEFSLSVTVKVLQSSSSVLSWEDFACSPPTRTKIAPPTMYYRMPTTEEGEALISSDYVFLLASRTVLGKEAVENLDKNAVRAIVDHLSGRLVLETDNHGRISNWTNPRGTLSLPGWRLLQFSVNYSAQLFPLVQNWVLVETRKMFYDYGPSEATKTWETTTMALLELRKAMLQAVNVNGAPPSLGDIIRGIRVHHNLSQESLDVTASQLAAGNGFFHLPLAVEVITEPKIYLSSIQNERGVEGVLRQCFEDMSIFFQMKLYTTVGPKEIRDWLINAHKRALELGYQHGEYVVQLFVTGVFDKNVENYFREWPENSMVFSNNALIDLFEPFGEGLLQEIIKKFKRD